MDLDSSSGKTSNGESRLQENRILRAARTLHAAHLAFNQNIWARPIESIQLGTHSLVEVLGHTVSDRWFSNFPHHFFTDNDRARPALLTHMRCDQALAFLHNLIQKLLQGSVSARHSIWGHADPELDMEVEYEALDVMLGDVPYQVVTTMTGIPPDWDESRPKHCILRIRSCASNRQWVTDLSGAQYGINNSVYSWEQYETTFVDRVVGSATIEYHRNKIARLAAVEGSNKLTFGLPHQAAEKLEEAMDSWELRHQRIATLVFVHDADFERLKRDLLECLDTAVRSFVREGDFEGIVEEAYEYMRTHPGQSGKETKAILGVE
jgi:hypothetical protein